MSHATTHRRERILHTLLEKQEVTVRELAQLLRVSEASVRRDLRALAKEKKLTLTHGGALVTPENDLSFFAKHTRNLDAKQIIGRLAATLVVDNQQIFLDSGTTSFEMAPHLKRRRSLSIITNSARLALEFNGSSNALTIIMLGGQYRPDRMDTVGPIASSTLEQLRGYTAFIGADGLSMDFGPSAGDIDSAHLYRLAVLHSRQTVLLVDHSKFTNASLFKIVDWSNIHGLVTDRRPAKEWEEFFENHQIKLLYPENS